MPVKLTFVAAILSLVMMEACKGQPGSAGEDLYGYITRKTDSLYRKEKLPGIFVGVLNNGNRSYIGSGFADPDQQVPFDSATLFEIGSITKTFTAYLVMAVLRDKGISDSSTILPWLPDSVRENSSLAAISFLSLLNHSSGLPRLPDNMDLTKNQKQPYADYTADNLYSYLRSCKPKTDGKYAYSNLGMGLAGVLAERISGKSYTGLLDQYIFQPFQLGKAEKDPASIKNKSQGYLDTARAEYWNMNILAPAGDLEMSASDLLSYLQQVANPATGDPGKITSLLLEPTIAVNNSLKVGRAWHMLLQKDGPVIYWHNGGTYGFSSFAAFLKGKNKAVVVVINQFNRNAISDGLGMMIMKKMSGED